MNQFFDARRVFNPFAVVVSAILAGTAAQAQDASNTSSQAEVGGQLEEVVVTAQKREESLQDTPISVSAFNVQAIEKFGVADIRDIGQIVPNMSVTETSSNATLVTVSMRGSVTGNPAPYWEPTVGMYLNGVFVGKTLGGMIDLIDVERIEVLRGPQGALYGKNTLSGAINYVERKPSGRLEGKVKAGVGNYSLWSAYGAIDTQAIAIGEGSLSASFGALVKQRDGLYSNTPDPLYNATGLTSPLAPSSSDFKSIDTKGARASLLWDVNPGVSALYEFQYQNVDQNPPLAQLTGIDPGSTVYPILNGYLTSLNHRAGNNSQDHSISEKAESRAHALHLDWKLGDVGALGDVTLKSITAYRSLDTDDAQDLDGSPIDLFHFRRMFDYQQSSQEFQLIGTTARTHYVLGLYYFQEEGDVTNPISFFPAFGAPTSLNRYGLDNKSYAIYGQVDAQFADRLTLTLGGRYTWEEKDQYIERPTLPYTEADASWTDFSPTFSAAYSLTDDANIYFRVAKGWKSGGFNGEAQSRSSFLQSFDPETVISYELGIKSLLFDRRLQVNAAAFYNEDKDMQFSVFLGGGTASSVIQNAGEATINGFELELVGQVIDPLLVFLNYGYLDTRYDKFIDGGVDVKDDRFFAYAPHNTATAGFDWTLKKGAGGSLIWHADWNYKDTYTPYVNPAQRAVTLMGNHHVVNTRLTLSDVPVGRAADLKLAFWVKNVTDEEYRVMATPFGIWTVSIFGEPRTYGLDVFYEF